MTKSKKKQFFLTPPLMLSKYFNIDICYDSISLDLEIIETHYDHRDQIDPLNFDANLLLDPSDHPYMSKMSKI